MRPSGLRVRPSIPLGTLATSQDTGYLKIYAIFQLSSLPTQEASTEAHLTQLRSSPQPLTEASSQADWRALTSHLRHTVSSFTLELINRTCLGSAIDIPHLFPSHIPTSLPMSKETPEQTTRLQSLPKAASPLTHTLPLQVHLLTVLAVAQIHSFRYWVGSYFLWGLVSIIRLQTCLLCEEITLLFF